MSKLKSKFLYLLVFIGVLVFMWIGVSFSYNQEPVKGINYLGEENGIRSYYIECSNGKSGYLYKDMVNHTIQIEVDGETIELVDTKFGDAVLKICE